MMQNIFGAAIKEKILFISGISVIIILLSTLFQSSIVQSSAKKITPVAPTPFPTLDYIVITSTPYPTPTKLPTPIPTRTPTPRPTIMTSSDLEHLFSRFGDEYHVDREQLKRIAKCESNFHETSVNGPYGGMFQFTEGAWKSARSRMGADQNASLRFQAEESIRTAAFKISKDGTAAWPSCR